ncbi:hypothetical protein [Salisediminibacterium selenitireducens]|uniref:Uncharacterized protein n=1 Tax=Bacillus selenitireducens (strain ATCC 700615 / DSM 15326 / MLS10) TaxID=439292 RepID=D6XVY6_BACIE|nr:hypothetical protein [Salisediminibacterium selenitireducens]ADH97759.1 hypothetical protein Bsel_0213 [[Bacillus] selenitireducens MLS10]
MKDFFNSAKGKWDQVKASTYRLKLDGDKLMRLAINTVPADKNIVIESIDVVSGTIVVTGKTMKYKINHNFSLTVVPDGFNDREISFKLITMKPFNNEWLKSQVFTDVSPYVHYDNSRFTLELNKIANVEKSPFGKIKESTIAEDKYVIGFGV